MRKRSAARRARASDVSRSIAACACWGYELPRSCAQRGDKDTTNPVSVSDDHVARKSLLLFD